MKTEEQSYEFSQRLERDNYWPSVAQSRLVEGRYADAIHLCKQGLARLPEHLSGRMIYALAVYGSGQMHAAREQVRKVLELDPEHLGALKLLGDIDYREGNVPSALAHYRRVLEIDPHCTGLKSLLPQTEISSPKLTLKRPTEKKETVDRSVSSRIPFFTETMGDLYLSQGHSRLAAEVFKKLLEQEPSDRLQAKLTRAERGGQEKENSLDVS